MISTTERTNMKTLKFETEIAHGGSVEGETLEMVLADLAAKVPSARFKLLTANGGAGGWPVFQIAFDKSDLPLIANAVGMDVADFVSSYAVNC
jgi:hypothetical protein